MANRHRSLTDPGESRRYRIQIAIVAVALGFAAPLLAAPEDTWAEVGRIVAIGDIHGDYERFVTLLRLTELIDANDDWIGAETHLVQTGDVPDRGPDSRKVMELLMKLEAQAEQASGRVHALIGNHEAMNMYGDIRYVHPGECASFINESSEAVQKSAYMQHVTDLYRKPRQVAEGLPNFNGAYRSEWEKENPLGHFEHREAVEPGGELGKWILSHNAVVKINDTLFVHGGIGPRYASLSIQRINKRVRGELKDHRRLRGGMVVNEQGPLWYRGLAVNGEESERRHLEALLRKHGVKRIVMGHTVTGGAIVTRFDGRAIFIDVGISKAHGGRLGALVIEGAEIHAVQEDETVDGAGGSARLGKVPL